MCGLAGVFGTDIDETSIEIFRTLATLSFLRGAHSTGFADYTLEEGLQKGFTPITIKKSLESSNDFYSPRGTWDSTLVFDKYYSRKNKFRGPVLCMSHSRHATIGKVSKENAHPFVAGKIIGMHNGTIRNDFENRDKYETDSEALFNLMNNKGEKEALETVAGLYGAAYALSWINRSTHTFHITRNKERPLYFVKQPLSDVTFYCSDSSFLRAVLPYYGIVNSPEPVPVDTHFMFDLKAKNIYESKTEEAVKPSYFFRKEETQKQTTTTGNSFSKSTGTGKQIDIGSFKPFKALKTYAVLKDWDEKRSLTSFKRVPMFAVSSKKEISEENFRVLLTYGCQGCGQIWSIHDDPVYMLQDEHSYLCKECVMDDQLLEFAFQEVNLKLAEEFEREQKEKQYEKTNETTLTVH